MEKKVKYAYYSVEQHEKIGYFIYQNAQNEKVICTTVLNIKSDISKYKWEDLKYIGEVTDFIEFWANSALTIKTF